MKEEFNYLGDQKHSRVDEKFAQLICWFIDNLTKREKDLIYITENFQRAYLIKKDIEIGRDVTKLDKKTMGKVEKFLKRQNIPINLD